MAAKPSNGKPGAIRSDKRTGVCGAGISGGWRREIGRRCILHRAVVGERVIVNRSTAGEEELRTRGRRGFRFSAVEADRFWEGNTKRGTGMQEERLQSG